jgi:hypothetical protein
MQFSTILTTVLFATLTAATPYKPVTGYNWTDPAVYSVYSYTNHTAPTSSIASSIIVKPTISSSVSKGGYAHPTASLTKSSTLPIFTGGASRPQSKEMVGLVLALGGVMVAFA